MDKNAIKNFAMDSRKNLTAEMKNLLQALHIEEELHFTQHGDIYENSEHVLSAMSTDDYKRYEKLKSAVNRDGIKAVIEKAAYTWFNRIVAIRYMEVNGFLPLGNNFEAIKINVLCDKNGDYRNPEIMTMSKLRETSLDLDFAKLSELDDKEKYKQIFLAIVKKLGEAIPDVFDGDTENIDGLIPNLLAPNGVIANILKLGEDTFKKTEIIGWLYQYYNQAEKDRVMGDKDKKAYEKEDIPFATQIFTPDWVVKYLVENSLGRYWLDRHPNKSLEEKWEYLVKKAEKSEVTPDNRSIEEITFIDPCSGSGHILIYAFEVFYQIYESEGYPKNEIPAKILNNNLYGLDIDDRANQLSILSCMMVARKYDDKLFSRKINRHVLSIREANKISLKGNFEPKGEAGDILNYLMNTFYDAKEYGSILKVRDMNYDVLRQAIKDDAIAMNLGVDKILEPIISQAELLSKKYTIAVTNPPYTDKYNSKLRAYLYENYPYSKANLGVVFIERLFDVNELDGVSAILTIESWMFLNYENFRAYLFAEHSILNMLHLGNGVFDGVQVAVTTATFNNKPGQTGVYYKLTEGTSSIKESLIKKELKNNSCCIKFIKGEKDFSAFPGSVIAYWASDKIGNVFKKSDKVLDIALPRQGMSTGDNDKFLRGWWEVNRLDECLTTNEWSSDSLLKYTWYPYNKGGKYRKWYGNNDYIIYWKDNGKEIKDFAKKKYKSVTRTIKNISYYFKPSITWSAISKDPSFRYKPAGHIFDTKGSSMFNDDLNKLKYVQGMLNTSVILKIASFLSPTMDSGVGQVASYPIVESEKYKDEIVRTVEECRELSKDDWDDFEISWDFKKYPFLDVKDGKLSTVFEKYQNHCEERFNKLKKNEERLNEIAIELYGLEDELTPDVPDDRVTVRKADREREAKSFLSYFVGCVMGRYATDKEGVQYAGEGTELPKNDIVDDDGIITILDAELIGRDDVINKLRKFLVDTFGEKNLSENLDWLADSLGRKNTERSEDAIRNYFVNEFFKNHTQIYCDPTKSVKKESRPIYWQLSSGEHNAFKALFYIHRYTPGLMAKVRMDYVAPILSNYERRLTEVNNELKSASAITYSKLADEQADLQNKIEELKEFDKVLKNVADQRIELDLDDGVKLNYPKLSYAAESVKKGAHILEDIK